jgi:hypothetical protein
MKPPRDEYLTRQFDIPDRFLHYRSRYQFSSEELQEQFQENIQLCHVEPIIDLFIIAATPKQPYIINAPGRAFVIWFVNTNDVYNTITNTGLDSFNPSTTPHLIWARVNHADGQNQRGFPIKHGRGFVGTFKNLALHWPSQENISARVVIYNWDGVPWMGGAESI